MRAFDWAVAVGIGLVGAACVVLFGEAILELASPPCISGHYEKAGVMVSGQMVLLEKFVCDVRGRR